jgi:general transcriptional corepressor TUP1
MYNSHRGMGPAPGNTRLNELLDGIRAEFETQARASGEYEHSSEFSWSWGHINIPAFGMPFALVAILDISDVRSNTTSIVAQQMQEMQMVREKVYQMEQTHLALKQK